MLRRAARTDVPAIVDLLADDDLGATRDGIRTEADLAVYQRTFDAIDRDPAQLLVVAEAGGRLVATLQLMFLPGLAESAGLDLDHGVLVDASLRSSDSDIYAVGDIAHHDHPVFGHRVRVEHWATALKQPAVLRPRAAVFARAAVPPVVRRGRAELGPLGR